MRQLKGDQQIEKNTASAAKRHLTGQGKSPLSGRDVMRQVEAEQAKGQLSPQTQKYYNQLMKSSPTRVFEDQKTGTTIILKEINIGKDEKIYKVFVKSKGSNEAIEAPILNSSNFDNELRFVIRTQSEDMSLSIQESQAYLQKFPDRNGNGSATGEETTLTLNELKGHKQKAGVETNISNYRPGALTMEVQYAGTFPDGKHFFIVGPQRGFYEGWRAYIQTKDGIKELEVVRCSRLRDGGTTTIVTKEGSFYFPVPERKGAPRFFNPDGTETLLHVSPKSDFSRLAQELKIPLKYHGKLPSVPL